MKKTARLILHETLVGVDRALSYQRTEDYSATMRALNSSREVRMSNRVVTAQGRYADLQRRFVYNDPVLRLDINFEEMVRGFRGCTLYDGEAMRWVIEHSIEEIKKLEVSKEALENTIKDQQKQIALQRMHIDRLEYMLNDTRAELHSLKSEREDVPS